MAALNHSSSLRLTRWIGLATVAMLCALGGRARGQATASDSARADESWVIVVNRTNATSDLTSDDLRRLFLGERGRWSANQKVTVVLSDLSPAQADATLRLVCGLSSNEFKRHWLRLTFTGGAQSAPKALGNAVSARNFVQDAPGAVGLLRLRDVDSTVKIVSIDGRRPDEPGYRLRRP